MAQSLEVFRRIRPYTHVGRGATTWDSATRRVIRGEAAMQVMADWARAEFQVAGAVPGHDVVCVPVPGSQAFAFQVDSFSMFRQRRQQPLPVQAELCRALMSPRLQRAFSLEKGSLPARMDVAPEPLEPSVSLGAEGFHASLRCGQVVPSWYMTLPSRIAPAC